VAIGGVSGLVWLLFLRALAKNDHGYPITLSALLLIYVVIERTGGSAALGILAFAVVVGNAPSIGQAIGLAAGVELDPDVRGFHSQMAFIIKSFFFTFIGAMMAPPWSSIALGVLLGLVLLAVRVPGVWAATLGSGLTHPQRRMVVVSMPRGMAAGVLATMPAAAGIEGTAELPTVVFAAVLTSILIFAVGFPLSRESAAPVAAAPPAVDEAGAGATTARGPVEAPEAGPWVPPTP
jgi:cell volume regulation protein A